MLARSNLLVRIDNGHDLSGWREADGKLLLPQEQTTGIHLLLPGLCYDRCGLVPLHNHRVLDADVRPLFAFPPVPVYHLLLRADAARDRTHPQKLAKMPRLHRLLIRLK